MANNKYTSVRTILHCDWYKDLHKIFTHLPELRDFGACLPNAELELTYDSITLIASSNTSHSSSVDQKES